MNTEHQLIKDCIAQNKEAQRQLYLKYAPLLKAICLRYEPNRENTQDLLQDLFIKIYANIHKFNFDGSFEGWLRRMTINVCINYLNRVKRFQPDNLNDNDIAEINDTDEQSIVKELMEAGFNKTILLNALHQIPTQYATVFNMFYIDNYSHKEIAETLNFPDSRSRKWLFKSRELLRLELLKILNQKQTHHE